MTRLLAPLLVPAVIIPAASLLAILFTAWLCHKLGLGGDVRIASRADALRLAHEAGFAATDAAVDRWGTAALTRDDQGAFTVIRRHGAHFAARPLPPPIDGRLNQRWLTLTPDPSFGPVTLDLGDEAASWTAALRNAR